MSYCDIVMWPHSVIAVILLPQANIGIVVLEIYFAQLSSGVRRQFSQFAINIADVVLHEKSRENGDSSNDDM